ncbi:hypothetical protein SNE40_017507 [Patella caerulea]
MRNFVIVTCLILVFRFKVQAQSYGEEDTSHVMTLSMELAQESKMNGVYQLRNNTCYIPYYVGPYITYPTESQSTCPHDDQATRIYRTINGTCNNILEPQLGQSNGRFKRYLQAEYDDGYSSPRIYSRNRTCTDYVIYRKCIKQLLPSARTVSAAIHTEYNISSPNTVMLMQWGQFLDHDFTAAAIVQPAEENPCCNHSDVRAGKLHPDSFISDGQCFPIPIVQDPSDRHFNRTCMNFIRSKSIDDRIGFFRPREQQNLLTAFIDGSNVYGSDDTTASHLRGQNGRMKTSGNNLLPRGNDGDCIRDNAPYCFAAGDERVHVFPGLTAMHTAFVRLHNYLVEKFDNHTTWDGEKLYQESRKVVGAILQRITYTEWLPEILNSYTMHQYRLNEGGYQYNQNVNPSISGVFGTAAFRFGHSLIPDFLVIDGQEKPSRKLFNNPQHVFTSLDSIVANLLSNPAQMRDRFVSREVSDHLFERNGIGFDLPAFNIQRGRDHGLPSYNMFRYFCGLPEVTSFNSSYLGNAGPSLQSVYAHVDDIDVFAGGMSEPNLPGSNLGPLFSCIIAQQFQDLKYGDSFWYETSDQQRGFKAAELASIKKIGLSKVLCQVFNLVKVQRNPFKLVTNTNPEVLCDSLDDIDLTPWY